MERIIIKKMAVQVRDYGTYTLTCYDESEDYQIWIFDNCIANKPINNRNTNDDGFLGSQLYNWLNNDIKERLPEKLGEQIREIRIPWYHEIFGNDYSYGLVEGDILQRGTSPVVEQYPLMKDWRFRLVGNQSGKYPQWYWLADPIVRSATNFALVNTAGSANSSDASNSFGVRPVLPINPESLISATTGGGIELYEIEEILF